MRLVDRERAGDIVQIAISEEGVGQIWDEILGPKACRTLVENAAHYDHLSDFAPVETALPRIAPFAIEVDASKRHAGLLRPIKSGDPKMSASVAAELLANSPADITKEAIQAPGSRPVNPSATAEPEQMNWFTYMQSREAHRQARDGTPDTVPPTPPARPKM